MRSSHPALPNHKHIFVILEIIRPQTGHSEDWNEEKRRIKNRRPELQQSPIPKFAIFPLNDVVGLDQSNKKYKIKFCLYIAETRQMVSSRIYQKILSTKPSKLSLDDLKRLCMELYILNNSARMHEEEFIKSVYANLPEDSEQVKEKKLEDLETEKGNLFRFIISITIDGDAGEKFTIIPGDDMNKVFSPINLPSRIQKIRFDNWSNYQLFLGRLPYYRMTLELDFKDSQIWKLNENFQNESHIKVSGYDETWVRGVAAKLRESAERKSLLISGIIHRYLNYNLVLWAIGIPLTFFIVTKSSIAFKLVETLMPLGLIPVFYLTICLLFLTFFRVFYNYIRWLFPYIELEEQPKSFQSLQRGAAAFIILGIVSGWLSAVADIIGNIRP